MSAIQGFIHMDWQSTINIKKSFCRDLLPYEFDISEMEMDSK